VIAILTSGVALGVHVPGLLLARRLGERGISSRVDVLEKLFPEQVREKVARSKVAFHRDFRLARAGQRMARDVSVLAGEEEVAGLLESWSRANVRRFVVFSGFWWPILDRAAHGAGVDVCHVDSVTSPSFRTAATRPGVRTIRLLDAAAGTIPYTIPVTRQDPVPWRDRAPRLLAHGGGWGMGTYADAARGLAADGVALDVVCYEAGDLRPAGDTRFFMRDPAWDPWQDDGFPPFGPVLGGVPRYARRRDHHDSFDLLRADAAVISKPGGGTLLDSLSAATPVLFTDPFGDHEARNAELWERLGLGMPLAGWQAAGRPAGALRRMHDNLMAARERVPDYTDLLVTEMSTR